MPRSTLQLGVGSSHRLFFSCKLRVDLRPPWFCDGCVALNEEVISPDNGRLFERTCRSFVLMKQYSDECLQNRLRGVFGGVGQTDTASISAVSAASILVWGNEPNSGLCQLR